MLFPEGTLLISGTVDGDPQKPCADVILVGKFLVIGTVPQICILHRVVGDGLWRCGCGIGFGVCLVLALAKTRSPYKRKASSADSFIDNPLFVRSTSANRTYEKRKRLRILENYF